MKDTQLVYVDDNKNVIEEIKTIANDDYDFNRLYFVNANELQFLKSLGIPTESCKYKYNLDDENCSARLVVTSLDIKDIKETIIKNIEVRYIFLKTGSQSATYNKFETHLDELVSFWKNIDCIKQQLINDIDKSNTIAELEKINFDVWPTYSLL